MWAASVYGMKCVHFLAGAEATLDSPPSNPSYTKAEGQRDAAESEPNQN